MKLDAEIEHLAIELGRALGQRGWLAATAESCTGGGVASAITRHRGQLRLVRSRICHLHQRGQAADVGGEQREP